MFGSVSVGSVYSKLKPKSNQNFQFLKIKNQNRTEPKFWQQFNRFQPFFRFVGFVHTLNYKRMQKAKIGHLQIVMYVLLRTPVFKAVKLAEIWILSPRL